MSFPERNNLGEERLFWLALWLLPGMGPVTFKKLLSLVSHPEEAFSLTEEDLSSLGLKERLIKSLKDKKTALERAAREARALEALGASLVFLTDPEYPSLLKEISDPPPLLYVQGKLDLGPYSLAVVGSRAATSYGKRVTRQWVSELARAGLAIVSGLAVGIDSEAHKAALKAEGYTVAVLGCGLDYFYPAQNRTLREKILASSGAIVTEFPLGTRPKPQNFPLRNRIISGLAQGVLVVEASLKSGSLITARLAAEQGREVMAVPGSVYSGRSHGCHRLIKEGALLVDKPSDVLSALGLEVKIVREEEFPDEGSLTLSEEEAKVLEQLEVYPLQVDDLAHKMGWDVSRLLTTLLSLELKGLVESQAGNYYQKVIKR